MLFIIPVESLDQNKGGVILYDTAENKILKQYVHDEKDWSRCGWRGGKLYGDYLIATDWTDLHYFNVKKWKYEKSFTHNTFNDLHYVQIHNDKLYVVNTGLDAIEIFNDPMDPKLYDRIFVFDCNREIFEKRKINMKETYNKRLKLEPHSCHPNCISFDKNRIIVTCYYKEHEANTGEVVDLKTGQRLLEKNYSCHDGIYYKDDFYLVWSHHATILKFNNLRYKEFPQEPTERIPIGNDGFWRGMIVYDNIIYVFSSDRHKGRKKTAKLAIIDMTTGRREYKSLPVKDGVCWDIIYQPNIYHSIKKKRSLSDDYYRRAGKVFKWRYLNGKM